MKPHLRTLLRFLTSLRLTIVLLVLTMLLVFFATLDQVNLGIWAVQQKWFRALFVHGVVAGISVPLFPGGYLIGAFLFANLLAAHIARFQFSLKKAGLLLIHTGLLILLVGEFLSGLWQKDFHMSLREGQTGSHAESFHNNELALIDTTAPERDTVTAIPEKLLSSGGPIQHRSLPFRIVVHAYYPNSALRPRAPHTTDSTPAALNGIGARIAAMPRPVTHRDDEQNTPSAIIELIAENNQSLGAWLVSTAFTDEPQTLAHQGKTWTLALRPARMHFDFSLQLQQVTHDIYPGSNIPKNFSSRVLLRDPADPAGREALVSMNKPLRHNGLAFYQYQMNAAAGNSVFQVVRNPARIFPYIACALAAAGLLLQFTQSLIRHVRKPSSSRTTPAQGGAASRCPTRSSAPAYKVEAASSRFVSEKRQDAASTLRGPRIFVPLLIALLCLVWAATTLLPPKTAPDAPDTDAFARLPVLVNGRIKPMDTVARATLLRIQGRQTVRTADARRLTPAEWLLDTCFDAPASQQYRVFEITHPEVLALARLAPADGDGKKRFSYAQLEPRLAEIERQARLADAAPAAQRDAFQRAALALHANLIAYQNLQYSLVLPESGDFLAELHTLQKNLPRVPGQARLRADGKPHDTALLASVASTRIHFQIMSEHGSLLAIPPNPPANAPASGDAAAPADWLKTGDALLRTFETGELPATPLAYATLARAWREKQPAHFNETLRQLRAGMEKRFPSQLRKAAIETRFNHAQPFYTSTLLYVLAFLLGVFSWLKWPGALRRSSLAVMTLAWLLTTAGILARMWLEGRPPVTNLYSSALGVGWCAVTLCIALEIFSKNRNPSNASIASVAGSFTGFCALVIAHNLALSGDTMEMMRAVLDSNFWLATHVVTITVGYGATFLAGMLAIIHIFRGLFTKSLDPVTAATLERMVYGTVCFATLFSLVGTVLGGIWADQSWGRFWGWDPKENGALLIVLWNAIILHARWGKLADTRGLMSMAVFGNIVTSFSWFGTNMLGVGLHSYGFMDAAFYALSLFIASQLAVIALATLVPRAKWRSGLSSK